MGDFVEEVRDADDGRAATAPPGMPARTGNETQRTQRCGSGNLARLALAAALVGLAACASGGDTSPSQQSTSSGAVTTATSETTVLTTSSDAVVQIPTTSASPDTSAPTASVPSPSLRLLSQRSPIRWPTGHLRRIRRRQRSSPCCCRRRVCSPAPRYGLFHPARPATNHPMASMTRPGSGRSPATSSSTSRRGTTIPHHQTDLDTSSWPKRPPGTACSSTHPLPPARRQSGSAADPAGSN